MTVECFHFLRNCSYKEIKKISKISSISVNIGKLLATHFEFNFLSLKYGVRAREEEKTNRKRREKVG